MFRLKHVNRAVLALCAGGAAFGAVAQQQQPQTLQRVEITGSNIKRISAETVAPVQIVTREQIERSGQPTIADVLRNIPANTGGSFGESFSNSFAPGAAGISLRGLGQKTTLVLLNGRRTAGYGFAQNLQDTFVDLNSIPSAAVERVEILKDGASAIYGSDAIAGVVNIILRKDYKGLEFSASGGSSEGKSDYRVTATGGLGDLGSDKWNVFATLDYYKRQELMLSDTKFGEDRDYRGEQGGRNFQSLTGGGTWAPLAPTASNPNALSTTQRQAIAGCPNVYTPAMAVAAGLLASTSALNRAGNTFCFYDSNVAISALPGTERLGMLSRGTLEISPNLTAYAELGLSRTFTEQTFTPPFFAATTGLQPTPAGLRPFTYNVRFAPGVAGNPYSTNAVFTGNNIALGTRDAEITSDSLRSLVGAKYTVGGWDLDSAVGYSKTEVEQLNFNRLSKSGVSAAFGIPSSAPTTLAFPLSIASTYNLNNPASNSAAVTNSLLLTVPRTSTSELTFIDTKATTELSGLTLPGGPVGLAVGVDFRREKLKDVPDPNATNGNILGQGITATNGSRSSSAIYAELALPITKQLEGQLAARYDKYSDYGSSATPKIGLKYTPNDMVAIRANWGKGFRAPTLPEISPSVATFFTQVIDPQDGLIKNISGVFAGNPNLKAEKSTSMTLGIVLEPTKNFNISFDLYKIDWRDVVASPSFQDILDASCPAGGTPTTPCPSTAQILRDPGSNDIVTVFSQYQNLASRKTDGVDIDARLTIPTATLGKFTTRANVTYIRSFKEDGVEYAGTNGGSNTIPRVKAGITQDWDYGAWSLSGRVNYTHGWRQDGLAASFFTPGGAVGQTGTYPRKTLSYTTLDLYARYAFTSKATISASLINALDNTPPYDPGFSSTFLYDFSQFDVRGRQFRLAFNYKFQ